MIVELENFLKLPWMNETIALTSMPGDPIHPGHISCLRDMEHAIYRNGWNHYGSLIKVCLVNDDEFLIRKKGFAFMPLKDRMEIIDSIKNGPDFVIPFTPSNRYDMSVSEGIEKIRPKYFLKGGDRKADETLPEWSICEKIGCTIIDGVGLNKRWSSSDYLKKYRDFILGNEKNV